MNKSFLIISLLLLLFNSKAQSNWAYTSGSIKEDEAMDISYDNSGNIITVGYFSGLTVFAPGINLNSSSVGIPDIYVTKSNSSGNIIWAKKAGGTGTDRALSVKTDGTGNIFITGFYYGIATFGSITLSSVSGSQDGFIAKMDPSGNFLWAKSFGGNLAEWGNAITVDNLGNPIITGQFQGTVNFSGTTLTSLINPLTTFSSFDVFIAKYNTTGTLLFVKQGASKFDDRGLDIITDNTNNIYLCGQFSDTIQFQFSHPNIIMNASFIIKYNAAGNEIWFRKMAGVFSIPYSMVMDNANKIYIAGDFQGTLNYFGPSSISTVTGLYSNKAFILKIDDGGSFIWGKTESSTNYVSSKRVALDVSQNPYIFGEFGCTMNEYSDAFGTGTFNSIGFGDLFITKYNALGTRQWFKQLGGPRNDKAHGLLISNPDKPIMAGSYEHHINLPFTSGALTILNSSPYYDIPPLQPLTYCSAPGNYDNYYSLNSIGYSDAFMFLGIDLTRNVYDYYDRNGVICNLNKLGCCINSNISICPDTIKLCKEGDIIANTKTGNNGFIGPLFNYSWNASLIDTNVILNINTSGYNYLTTTTIDGCYSSTDTVYVKINPLPAPPVITDSYGANALQPPLTYSIHVCGPATYTLTGGNVASTTYLWSGPYVSTHDSIAIINTSGNFYFDVRDANGCENGNNIDILIDSPLATLGLKQKNDSVEICAGSSNIHIVCDTITNPTLIYPYACSDYSGGFFVSTSPGLLISPISTWNCDLSFIISATTTGNYTYTAAYILNNLCVHDTMFFTGHVFIKVLPSPNALLSITGNTLICPGDSTLLVGSLSAFSSTNIVSAIFPNDSIWVNSSGYTYISAYLTDTISGCTMPISNSKYVQVKPNPLIILSPYNAIICPFDSVKLTINLPGAINYEWHGPGGLIPINSQFIYVKTGGFYHCIVTDNSGCVFTTNTIEVKIYATPFLACSPTNIICSGSSINIHVSTLDSSMIVWSAPLSGGGATKVITTAGTYSCTVTMCGITTSLSIVVIESTPTASITALGPTTMCPFDSVKLTGNIGMVNYVWQPGGHIGIDYVIHSSGCYTLEVTDAFGCNKKSSPICVTYTSSVMPPFSVVNDTVCFGQTAILSASSASLSIDWFSNAASGPILYTGTTFTTPPIGISTTTFYAASVNASGCHSSGVPVTAFVYPTSLLPILITNTIICQHDTIKIISSIFAGVTYSWSCPGLSGITSNSICIPNADSTHAGLYTLQISGYGCTSPTASISIRMYSPISPSVFANDSICENSNYSYAISPSISGYFYDWVGPFGFSSTNDSLLILNATLLNAGTYSVVSNLHGCLSSVSTISLTVLQTPAIPIITASDTVCAGDTIFLSNLTFSPFGYNWYGSGGFYSTNTNTFVLSTISDTINYYSLVLNNYFCMSLPATATVIVVAVPSITVTPDTVICNGSSLTLNCASDYPFYNWSTGSILSSITPSASGTYYITSFNGACSTTDSVNVLMVDCDAFTVNVFSPNGDGANDLFKFNSKALKEIHCEIRNRWGEKVGEFTGKENGWNGKNIKNDNPCDEGTYFYIAEIITINGVSKNLKGFLNLFR